MSFAKIKNNIIKNWQGVIDVTLREGEQFAGHQLKPHEFSLEESEKIVNILHLIGVKKIEVGNPLAKGMEKRIKHLLKIKERPQIFSHIRNHPKDAAVCFKLKKFGLDGIHILTTVDQKRLKSMGHSLPTYLKQLEKIVVWAKKLRLEVRVGVEHSWNIPLYKSLPVYQLAANLKVDRISIADTLGTATHWEVKEKISLLRKYFPSIMIEVHFHNDFLSAVSNSLQALASGANYIDTTLAGGIGERTGITPLSVLLARLYKIDPSLTKKYQCHFLKKADYLVASIVNIPLPFNLITSINAFAHRSGIHINGILNFGPTLYEPIDPHFIGNQRYFQIGTNISGKTKIEQIQHFIKNYDYHQSWRWGNN